MYFCSELLAEKSCYFLKKCTLLSYRIPPKVLHRNLVPVQAAVLVEVLGETLHLPSAQTARSQWGWCTSGAATLHGVSQAYS